MEEPMDVSVSEEVSPVDVSMAEVFTPKKSSINFTINSNPHILNNTFQNNNKFNSDNTDCLQINNSGVSPIQFDTTDNSINDFKTPQTSFSITDINKDTYIDNISNQQDVNNIYDNKNLVNITVETIDKENLECDNLEVVNANVLNATFEQSPCNVIGIPQDFDVETKLNVTVDAKSPVLNTTFDGKSPSSTLNTTFELVPKLPTINTTFEGNTSNNAITNTFEEDISIADNVPIERKSPINIICEGKSNSLNATFDGNTVNTTIEENTLVNVGNVSINEKPQLATLSTTSVQDTMNSSFEIILSSPSNLSNKLNQSSSTCQSEELCKLSEESVEPKVQTLLDLTLQNHVDEKKFEENVVKESLLDSTFGNCVNDGLGSSNNSITSRIQERKTLVDPDVSLSLLNITAPNPNVITENVIIDKIVQSEVLDDILECKENVDEVVTDEEEKLSKTIESVVEIADKAINESFNSSLNEEAALKEDRIPLKNLHDNTLEQCKGKKEEMKFQMNAVKCSDEKENLQCDNLLGDPKAILDSQKYDFSIFSNSPAKVVVRSRNSILQLFDPLSQPNYKPRESLEPPKEFTEVIKDKESELVKSLKEALDITDDHNHKEFINHLPEIIKTSKLKMDEALEQKIQCEQELNKLKLELNQLQQENTALELALHQKDEIILKTQGEAQKRENQFKQEIKQLNEKLNNISEQNNNEEVKSLKEEIASLRDRESQLSEKLNKLVQKENSFQKVMLDYESTLSHKFTEFEKLKGEHDTAKKHLATLEMSFSDLHTKYERSKDIIAGFKNNEEALTRNLEGANQLANKNEERYESLKAHAKAQIEKSNKELTAMKEKHTIEMNKLSTIIKRLDIKNGSIQQALDQKTKECAALAALCDEMTGACSH